MSDQPIETELPEADSIFRNALYDVEHALSMYATSFCTIPAEGIYDQEALAPLMTVIESCHIYIIGFVPVIDFLSADQNDRQLSLNYLVNGNEHTVISELPDGLSLHREDGAYYLSDNSGQRFWPTEAQMQCQLSNQSNAVNFEAKYIGQAYGKDGSRNAVDRLLKHETLQKIAVKGIPNGFRLTLLLLQIQPNTQIFTVFNPHAQNKDEDSSRIDAGLDKLHNTNEQERIALYEASLIRYFYPEYNKEFKNSFPSTNLKILQDCYDKDFSSVVAEICIDELPYKLYSEKVAPKNYHFAHHNLHDDEARRIFFGL